jgi:hypothetical protein
MTYGFFSKRTYPRHCPCSSFLLFRFQPPLPAAFPSPPGCHLRGRGAFAPLQVLFGRPTTHTALLPTSPLRLIGSLIAMPLANCMSPPGVTLNSSVPCHPQTPWCDGWMRTPSPLQCGLDLAPSLADRFINGVAPSITARYFSSCPSDSTSRWTPCPPVVLRQIANLGPSPWLFPPFPVPCPFRVHLIHFLRPARHYPRFWI